jgi:hypothetical protein
MADLILLPYPTIRLPNSTTYDLMSNDGYLPASSNGFQQGLQRSGACYMASVSYSKLPDAYRQTMKTFLNKAASARYRFRLPDHSLVVHGSLQPTEQVKSGSGLTSVADWTAGGSTLSVNAGCLKVKSGGSGQGTAAQQLTLVDGAQYLLRVMVQKGTETAFKVGIGSTSGSIDIANQIGTANGEAFLSFTAGATNWVILKVNSNTANVFLFFDQISVTQCLSINGADQSGSSLLISGAPVSTNGVIAKGDLLQLDTDQLVRADMDGDSNSAGDIWLPLETPLRAAPTDSAGIALCNPSTKFMLPPGSNGAINPVTNSAPMFADFSFQAQEDIYAKAGGA